MRSKLLIIPAVLIFKIAGAQSGPALAVSQSTFPAVTVSPSSPVAATDPTVSSAPNPEGEKYIDYKSVYEAATLEDEVQLAAERFGLTKSQQDVWADAATDRRLTEKQFREKFDSKAVNSSKEAMYKGLRSAQSTFYETVIGYLSPAQKARVEFEREVVNERERRLAKIPPPPPPPPTVTVAPIDSTAIKAEEKAKAAAEKKSKKKKRSASATAPKKAEGKVEEKKEAKKPESKKVEATKPEEKQQFKKNPDKK
jgi:hypothetical protein